MDISQFLTNEVLEDYQENNPIIIKGLSRKFDIIIYTKKKDGDK